MKKIIKSLNGVTWKTPSGDTIASKTFNTPMAVCRISMKDTCVNRIDFLGVQ